MKHGCCYIAPVESDPDVTCHLYANPGFRRVTTSDALCGAGKSSPEFSTPRKPRGVSLSNLDDDHKATARELQSKLQPCRKVDESEMSTVYTPNSYETKCNGESPNKTSCVMIYGNKLVDKCDSEKDFSHMEVSDCSVYRPTTKSLPHDQIPNSEKFLDCLSLCLWKCSTWCQKVDEQ
ncbi:hypothetical protein CBL_09496 [Carabus blaptoides fortunei]